jgi:pyruvate/2-oxoglutarate dehydrogenase complex dihydrolipoamide dehydrogenase (E3) component
VPTLAPLTHDQPSAMSPAADGVMPHFPALVPGDESDRRLLETVHPPSWRNPTPKERYHVVVIGAGTAGLVTAAASASLGARVALVERHLMGGDCLNVGCVPSKGIIRAARAWHAARTGDAFGAPVATGRGDFAAAMGRMRDLRATMSHIDGAARFRDLGVDVFFGDARFEGPDRVVVDDGGAGARLRFRRAVVASGARAAAPAIPGLADAGYRTNETIFALTELPRRLVVIGAGPIGCELAQTFARFGSEVTVLDTGPRILPRDDAAAAAVVERAMTRDGVRFVHGCRTVGVGRRGDVRVVRAEQGGATLEVEGDELLVAAGRAPNVEGLGLEAAGIAYDRAGVTVDDRLRTTNPRVFAVGDICSRAKFTHAADAQARIVVANANFFGRGRASRLIIPWATYTSPEVAHVGIGEAEAAERRDVDTIEVPLHDVDRARLDGEDEGFLRVYLAKGSDRILGATLVAEHAGDMISEITLAMTAGIGLSKVGATIHPYPTQAEVMRKAADAWRRRKLTPAAKRAFAWWFRTIS